MYLYLSYFKYFIIYYVCGIVTKGVNFPKKNMLNTKKKKKKKIEIIVI